MPDVIFTPEEIEKLKKSVEEYGKKIALIQNTSFREFMKEKKITGIPWQQAMIQKMAIFAILGTSIDANSYDKTYQRKFNNPNLKFFQELKDLISNALNKNKDSARSLIKAFLDLNAIEILVIDNLDITSKVLMDEAVLQLREIYKSEDTIPINELQMNFVKITSDILKKSNELLKLEGRIKSEAENLTNKIKNNYETVRYVIRLILGCFDLLENRLSNNLKNYFHPNKTPWQLYFPPKYRKEFPLWLKDYFNLPQYVNQYYSLSFLFEEWIFKHFREVRHFKAHKEIDTAQTILKNNLYKIEFDNKEYKYTLCQLRELYKDSFGFLLWIKHLVAKIYFNQGDQPLNEDLYKYLLKNY